MLWNNTYSQSVNNISQSNQVSELFKSQKLLPLKLNYSNKYLKKKTNDSTYLRTKLSYKTLDDTWNIIDVEIRKRGNFRLKNCYYAPIKIKVKKSNSKGTLFEGNKKLKLVHEGKLSLDKYMLFLKEKLIPVYEKIVNEIKTR